MTNAPQSQQTPPIGGTNNNNKKQSSRQGGTGTTMAKQFGPIKLQGTIGDLTFFKGDDGTYGAKAKSAVSKERIATDPAFLRTRENGQEFGRPGHAGKVLRRAFNNVISGSDKRMTSRLHKAFMKCVKADTS